MRIMMITGLTLLLLFNHFLILSNAYSVRNICLDDNNIYFPFKYPNKFISNSEENSNEYFTNDNITPSIKKMGVNCFENSFFTKSISGKMLKPMIIKSIVVFLLFLILAIANNHLFVTALQIALPYTIIQQTIRLFVFHNRIENIYKRFRQIFTTHNKKTITQSILHNVSSYETTLAWACIKLDSKLFEKWNDKLSEKWNSIKTKCNIA